MDTELGLNSPLVVDVFDTNEGVIGPTIRLGLGNHDLLYQPELKRLNRVKPVDQIVWVAVRGGVTKRAKRVQCPNGFLGLLRRIDALRFVDDDDGPGGLHEFDGGVAGKLIHFLVNDVAFLLCFGSCEVCGRRLY